jgi:dTDP-4-amino-4,6-dideoxygalactose transaminase
VELKLSPAVTHVPFIDLAPIHLGLKERILADVGELIDSSAFTNGPQVAAFEAAFARYCGTRDCVGLASGLDALRLGLIAAGLRPGDRVIVPANTFVATVEAVTQAGGVPVLVDAGELDYNIDVEAVAEIRGARFLIPVHLYGQLADMQALNRLAGEKNLAVVEDACQAHGATRDDLAPGSGACAAFSFYPAKNLGAMGDAGALVTNDLSLAEHVRALREHGQRVKYHHELEGYTARLDTIQAIVLEHKLALLDEWTAERRAVAETYNEALEGIGDLVLPPVPAGSVPVWHVYAIRTRRPAGLADFLRARGVASGRHYPEPVHLSPAYAALGHARGAFPVAERLAGELLSLPIFTGMTEAQVEAVVDGVRTFFDNG